MVLLKRDEIEDLATYADGPQVSLYLPTHSAGQETAQDPIRFKNLLTVAEQDLVAQGVRATVARDLLAPARRLLDDRDFWLHQGDGLGVFVSAGGLRVYRLPFGVPEMAVVADRFHVKPLLRLLSEDGRFYVLALSQNRVRLFEARRDGIREIDLGDVPESLRDAVGYDWEQPSLQFHTGAGPGPGGKRRAMFHGQGSPGDDDKEEIASFLQQVDRGITALLAGERAPLVLAGVEYVTALYRAITAYPQVLAEGLDGNPDRLSPDELLAAAWRVVEPRFAAEQVAALARYEALVGEGRATNDLDAVLQAAFAGRVETLIAAPGVQQWGRFDERSQHAEIHEERRPGDRDLVDLAVVQSLRTGADVYAVEPERVPGRGVVAAIFRY